MRKPLMMVCCAVFLTSMCFGPRMYGDAPPNPPNQGICPKTKPNTDPMRGLCKTTGIDISEIGPNGSIKTNDNFAVNGCPAVNFNGFNDCDTKKLAVFLEPNGSVGMPSGRLTYHDIVIPIVFAAIVGPIPTMTDCCTYVYCKTDPITGVCEFAGYRTSYQLFYDEYGCVFTT